MYREIHVFLKSGHLYKYRNCEMLQNDSVITIEQGRETSWFPLNAIEMISALNEDSDHVACFVGEQNVGIRYFEDRMKARAKE